MVSLIKRLLTYKKEGLLLLFLITQGLFSYGINIDGKNLWKGTHSIKPELGIVPPVPTLRTVRAVSFGDEQFYFRILASVIQNAGDTYGRSTPLKDYNYAKLYQWWILLDELDNKSNIVPAMVSYYYSASQEPERDVPYVIDYLEQHADRDPIAKWWWYTQAVYNARHRLKNMDRALSIAQKLTRIPDDIKIPLWARQMPAFIHEARGELEESYIIIRDILNNIEDIPKGELNFMYYFIKERVKKFEEYVKESPKM